MLRRVVWYKLNDFSEVLAAKNIRANKGRKNTTTQHGATTQKTVIFIFAAVRTSDLTMTAPCFDDSTNALFLTLFNDAFLTK
jgi:hypothetical protein